MNFDLTEDQTSILSGLDQLIDTLAIEAPKDAVFGAYATDLDTALAEAGFFDIAREDGFGPLDATLLIERLARLPRSVEAAASAVVAPAIGLDAGLRPIALTTDPLRPTRFLPMARLLLVDRGEDVLAVEIDPSRVVSVETLFAYPYGRLDQINGLPTRLLPGAGATLRRRWRIALAAEAAGLMAAALAHVVEHVSMRHAFGRPLGSFQAIQHRLAMAAETAESTKWLSFRAAWSDDEADAAVAAGFAQDRISQFTYDLHQFCGAMALTLEFPLHHWTYRLRALMGELGGSAGQASVVAAAAWPHAA